MTELNDKNGRSMNFELPTEFRSRMRGWFIQKNLSEVDLLESSELDERNSDYNIIYEASFISKNTDHLMFNVFLTESMSVGVAIENYARIAFRLGVNTPFRERVCGGWEPPPDSYSGKSDYTQLFDIMDQIAYGRKFVVAFTNGFVGLYKANIRSREDFERILDEERWVETPEFSTGFGLFGVRHVLRYRAWS